MPKTPSVFDSPSSLVLLSTIARITPITITTTITEIPLIVPIFYACVKNDASFGEDVGELVGEFEGEIVGEMVGVEMPSKCMKMVRLREPIPMTPLMLLPRFKRRITVL